MGLNVLLHQLLDGDPPSCYSFGFCHYHHSFCICLCRYRQNVVAIDKTGIIPWALFSGCILGVGIMMGGKWAYESLSFGGYWANPVENASLVPRLLLVAGLHTMVIYRSTGHSSGGYLFAIPHLYLYCIPLFLPVPGYWATLLFIHRSRESTSTSWSEPLYFALCVADAGDVPAIVANIPAITKEEQTGSREFWMFIGALIFFLSALFIICHHFHTLCITGSPLSATSSVNTAGKPPCPKMQNSSTTK